MSAQPPVDFQTWQPAVWNQVFTMGVGTNSIVIPGFNRDAALNPATVPNPSTRGGRRWLSLSFGIDTSIATGENFQFNYSAPGGAAGSNFHHALVFFLGAHTFPADVPFPLVRTTVQSHNTAGSSIRPWLNSLWAPDPFLLYWQILNMTGGEEVTFSGVYVETRNREQVPPDLWP